jgi:hypothetical protein
MTNSIIPIDDTISSLIPADDSFTKSLATFNFLPRLQLLTPNSADVQDGKYPPNTYVLIKNKDNTDLGQTVTVTVVAGRPKAMDFNSGGCIVEFDYETERFKSIQSRSTQQQSNCMWGKEYLVYVPKVESFAGLFYGTPTARNSSPEIESLLPTRTPEGLIFHSAVMSNQKVSNAKNPKGWYSFKCTGSEAPAELPSIEEVQEEMKKFLTMKSTEVKEEAPETNERDR